MKFGIGVTVALIILVVAIIIALMGYVKAPPDVAFIISGFRRKPKILIGRSGIRIPFLERKDVLLLRQISVDIKTNGFIPTEDFIGVSIDAVAKIRIKNDAEGIQIAMKNFLNMNEEQIIHTITDSLQGNMREIVGTIKLRELCNDRKKFGDEVQSKAQLDMDNLGIQIISCNIQTITDEQELIPQLGQDNMSQIQKDASIAKANADRDVAIATAEAQKEANAAQVEANKQIAEKNNELAIKQADLKVIEDTKRAEAEAAFKIQEQIQNKTIESETVNAQIAKAEREAELKSKEVLVKQQELAANIERQADAEKYRQQKEAEAKLIREQKEAEAVLYRQKQEAEAIRARGLAEAEAIRVKGEAEADAIKARGEAEAAAMDKKAEAYAKYNNAAIAEMMVRIIPEVAREIASPISQIDKINIYGGGANGDGGASQISGITPQILHQVFDTMTEATGVDMRDILKANTYDAKVNKNVNITGVEGMFGTTQNTEEKQPVSPIPEELSEDGTI
ncbi:MAG: flotillin family protein [Lachnospiraceae bacterium]|nr:flotillin family protein [Lachnospiraceae bacterium]